MGVVCARLPAVLQNSVMRDEKYDAASYMEEKTVEALHTQKKEGMNKRTIYEQQKSVSKTDVLTGTRPHSAEREPSNNERV